MRPVIAVNSLLLPLAVALIVSFFGHYPAPLVFGFAVLTTTVLLWVTESLPLPATALLVPVLIVVYGVDSAANAFSPFGSSIIFLFVGAFLLARGMQKHHWDQRLSYWVLRSPFGTSSFLGLAVALGGISFFLSMWISNTATTAMMCPLVVGIMSVIARDLESAEERRKATIFLLLLVAYAASTGGLATPVGTPPNLITLGLLRERGIEIDFLSWVAFGLPIALTMFCALILVLSAVFRVKGFSREKFLVVREHIKSELHKLGPVKKGEMQVAVSFSLAVLFWLLPGMAKALSPESDCARWLNVHLPMATVGLAAGLLLFFLPIDRRAGKMNLGWSDARDIDWGTIMLFGGGLSLGTMLSSTGIALVVGETLFASFTARPLLLTIVAAAFTTLFTEVVSNTATTTIVVSILLGTVSQGVALPGYAAVIASCLAASYAFMLPVATPPNAIVFGTGQVPLRQMIRVGVIMNIVGVLIVVFFVEGLQVLRWIE